MTEAKKRGRPSSFRHEFVEQARKMCLLGLTDTQMAGVFGVAESTFHKWKIGHPEFSEALKSGKEIADADVAASLYHRAIGYSHEAVKIMQYEGVPIQVKYTEHYPPDTAAAFIWLKNRQPKLWRDKSAPEDDEVPSPVSVVVNVIDASSTDAES